MCEFANWLAPGSLRYEAITAYAIVAY